MIDVDRIAPRVRTRCDPKEMSVDSDSNSDYPSSAGIRAGQPGKITVDSRADSIEHSNALAQCQVMADRADSAWSRSAPSPWTGESIDGYLRRLTRPHKSHSENWKDVDLGELRGQALKNAASQIFADSIEASCNPIQIGAGRLHEVKRRDPDTGHMIKEYFGDPQAWMARFSGQKRIARFNLSGRRGGE
jgi:hypothetical protein